MSCLATKPCLRCTRVPCPETCNDIHCADWRSWFCAAWQSVRTAPRRQMDQVQTVPLGVPLGGHHYAPPHLIREYRQKDPCRGCSVKPVCTAKCNVRSRWEQQGGCQ